MCYSAEASFIAGGALTVASISIARLPKEKASLPLSIIPAVFAAHQLIEGGIWLVQDGHGVPSLGSILVLLYVFIAYIFWPVFIPYVAYRMEPDHRRRMVMMTCQVGGLVVGFSYLLGILRTPVNVSVTTCNLAYQVNSLWNIGPAYLLAVTVPFLVSSHRGLVLFGLAVLSSCGLALYLESIPSFPSVWCFFAAFLSAGLYAYFRSAQTAVVAQSAAVGKPAG
jgi:hypothetical protein